LARENGEIKERLFRPEAKKPKSEVHEGGVQEGSFSPKGTARMLRLNPLRYKRTRTCQGECAKKKEGKGEERTGFFVSCFGNDDWGGNE